MASGDDRGRDPALKDGEPEKVVVFGAGTDAVNGEYRCTSRNLEPDSAPVYTKIGQWEGKLVTFFIECYPKGKHKPQSYRWKIGIRSPSETTIYVSNAFSTASLPPSRGWLCSDSTSRSRPPIVFHDDETLLDWRTDPQESLTDFTIEITAKCSSRTEYHVHKLVVANASKYFAALCVRSPKDGSSFVEGATETSRIELGPSTAARFPYLLDYMYMRFSGPSELTEYRPVKFTYYAELYWLADYFQVPRLCKELERAWKRAMTLENCHVFARTAIALGVQPIIDAVSNFCAAHLLEIKGDDMIALVKSFNLQCLTQLLQRNDSKPEPRSAKASELVASFIAEHEIDATDFKALTAASFLPHIDADAVWPLLKKNSELTEASEESLCDLQLRCIDGLANSFISIEASADGPLCLQSSLFLRKLIEKSQEKVQARARAGQFHHGNARQR